MRQGCAQCKYCGLELIGTLSQQIDPTVCLCHFFQRANQELQAFARQSCAHFLKLRFAFLIFFWFISFILQAFSTTHMPNSQPHNSSCNNVGGIEPSSYHDLIYSTATFEVQMLRRKVEYKYCRFKPQFIGKGKNVEWFKIIFGPPPTNYSSRTIVLRLENNNSYYYLFTLPFDIDFIPHMD